MKKPWSITTTLRNPERLRDFLTVLKDIAGEEWNLEIQKKYQILLIKHRKYGCGSSQFYKGLSPRQINLINDLTKEISVKEAENIFNTKSYKDPAMRGRQSINVFKKLGLASIKAGKIFITDLGRLLLKADYDFGEIFFRSFIKWQIPNPDNNNYKLDDGYDIKPFIGTLHLINTVNKKAVAHGEESKGISKQEFSLFAPTLVYYKDIKKYADEIIKLRTKVKGKNKQEQKEIFKKYEKQFAQNFLDSNNTTKIKKLSKDLKDYGDNAIRYFRLTRFLYIRGGGFYVDLEPRRQVEIKNLLASDTGKSLPFVSKEKYLEYIANVAEPKLPWETKEKLKEILEELIKDIRSYEKKLSASKKEISNYNKFNERSLKKIIGDLRGYRRH